MFRMQQPGIIFFIISVCVLAISCTKNDLKTRYENDVQVLYSGKVAAGIPENSNGAPDIREAETGTAIYQNAYVDQAYLVRLVNGSWLCTYTQSKTAEGGNFETIGVSISSNKGKTWSFITDLEPPTNPVAFYAVPFVTGYGRVYIIYGYNDKNVLTLYGARIRTDAVGEMCYKYSDNNGLTWSPRQVIKMPLTQYDLINNWGGQYSMWWSVCKPILSADNQMYFSFTKLAKYLYTEGEGWVVNSPNLNSEKQINKIIWNFLPPGIFGIRSSTIGLVQEEHNIVQLNDGSFYCVFRTSNGYPACCYSKDNCKTWSEPVPVNWGNGQQARNPRACARVFKLLNGKYLLWFENNAINKVNNRNPAWVLGGTESGGLISWSQPEVLLYSRDTTQRFSYPDIIEDDGNYYLTETQKTIARVSTINPDLLNSLWSQGTVKAHSTQNLITDLSTPQIAAISGKKYVYSNTANTFINGLTLNMTVNVASFNTSGQTVLSLFSNNLRNTLINVRTSSQKTIEIDVCNESQLLTSLFCDNNLVKLNSPLFISISMDPQSRVLSAMVNGVLCNGAVDRTFGWVEIPASFDFSTVSNTLQLSAFSGKINKLQIYNIALTTGQMLSEYLAAK